MATPNFELARQFAHLVAFEWRYTSIRTTEPEGADKLRDFVHLFLTSLGEASAVAVGT